MTAIVSANGTSLDSVAMVAPNWSATYAVMAWWHHAHIAADLLEQVYTLRRGVDCDGDGDSAASLSLDNFESIFVYHDPDCTGGEQGVTFRCVVAETPPASSSSKQQRGVRFAPSV